MPVKTKQQSSPSELLRTFASGFRRAATRPNIHGYIPHPKQILFHTSEARGKQFIGGNRSGKTVGGAVECVNRLRGIDPFKAVKHQPPVAGRCVAVDFLDGVDKIVKPEIARWLPPSDLKNGSWEDSYDKVSRTLTLTNGSTLEFMSYEQSLEKFAGTSRNFIWFDEEPPQQIWEECLMRLIDVSGDWWMTMTPVEGMTWTYDTVYIAARTDDNLFVVEVETDENPHINPGEIDILQAGLSDEDKKSRRKGQYIQIGGLIYKMLDEKHFIGTFQPPKEWLHFAMLDHGLANATCWLWGAVNKDGFMVIYDEHYESGQVVSHHAAEVHRRNQRHGRVPDYYVGDPSIQNRDPLQGSSVHVEYANFGIPIVLGNNDFRAGVNLVTQKLIGSQGIPFLYIQKEMCPHLVYELQRYRWATWANRKMQNDKNRKEEPHKKDDHSCDALRYGVASRPQMDTGQYIPEITMPEGANVAASPYRDEVDTALVNQGRVQSDPHLGNEY